MASSPHVPRQRSDVVRIADVAALAGVSPGAAPNGNNRLGTESRERAPCRRVA
jgi:hypothetical protein